MIENKATGHKSKHVGLTVLFFGTFLAILGLGQKVPNVVNQISKVDLKRIFGFSNYIFSLHLTHILILIKIFYQK